jgi:hypothetical protein
MILVSAVVSVACLALAASANATVVRSTGWVQVPVAGYTDCDLWTQLLNNPTSHVVSGQGSAWCGHYHGQIAVVETLKQQSVPGAPVSTYTGMFTPLVETKWVPSPGHYNGCDYWQVATNLYVNGVKISYQTSGTPVKFTEVCPY